MAVITIMVCFPAAVARSADNVTKPASGKTGATGTPVAGSDNAVSYKVSGTDNVVEPSVVYDAKTDSKKILEAWGIRFESLRLTAAGAMLDFRYRIMDPAKAHPLVDRRNKPYMIAQATGEKMGVPSYPKVGPLRQTTRTGKPKLGKIYFVLFANHGKKVKPGDKVSVVIGDFAVKNLVVQ